MMTLITEEILGIALESQPDCDLNPRPLNFVQMLYPSEVSSHELNSL